MGIKQSLVVVNEYTVMGPDGKGSRGSTPGDFIVRYMARELATETVEPIRRFQADDFIVRYMAREDATEVALDVSELKELMSDAQGDGGVAFGYGSASLSHDELIAGSRDVQRLFDEGKTVLKTVISFDQQYLVDNGLVPEGFVPKSRGDYRGNVDQMKLRLAIMRGMERMNSGFYDDLRYIAVIQVDTHHVHAHLAMVDAGAGSLAADGTQKGKIGRKAVSALRRGIDSYLDEKQVVKHLSSAVDYERRNVQTYVKKWAHGQVLKESMAQFLLACLPEDRRLWRASTNHRSMRKANRVVRDVVEEVLARPGSPMGVGMARVRDYANGRAEREGLSRAERQRLVDDGRAEIVERGVNAVYSLLRQLPEDALRIRTPILDVMSADYEEVARLAAQERKDDELVGFGYRLRSYSSRLAHHNEKRAEWKSRRQEWEDAFEAGAASEPSRALRDFYAEEELYHARCAAKYRDYLSFAPAKDDWLDGWEELQEYGDRLLSLESMSRDASLKRTGDPERAEAIGLEVYGQPGGSLVSIGGEGEEVIQQRIAAMRRTWDRRVEDYSARLAGKGLVLSVEELTQGEAELADREAAATMTVGQRGRKGQRRASRPAGAPAPRFEASASRGTEFPFEEVKGLDMHHLRWDFPEDAEVGEKTFARFAEQTRRRATLLNEALVYLEDTGQLDASGHLPVEDVTRMEETLAQVAEDGRLKSTIAELQRRKELLRRSRTVRIDGRLQKSIEERVDTEALREFSYEDRLHLEPDAPERGVQPALGQGAGAEKAEGLEQGA